jgi:MFS transporter, ACS family, aldohexuronate transporter
MSLNRRRLLLALLIVSGVLNYADRQIIAVLKPMLQDDLHWTDSQYGNLTALFQFAAAIAFLGAGWFVDRVGWRKANSIAVSSWSLAAMAHALAHTLGQFTLARVALGATESLGTPASVKTIAVLFEAKARSAAMGAMNAASNVGAIVTPLTVPTLALALGWKAAFLITGGLGLLWVVAWFAATAGQSDLVVPEKPGGSSRVGSARTSRPDGTANVAVSEAAAGAALSWFAVLQDRRTWAIAGGKLLSDQVWWFLLFWAPDFFHRVFHLDMRGFAVPLAVIYTTAACGSILGGIVSGRLVAAGMPAPQARKRVMLVCALLATPVPLALSVDGHWLAVGLLALTLAAHQGFAVNLFALAADVTSSSRIATVISIAALFGNLSGMVVLQAAGWLIGSGHGYGPLFGLAGASYLLAVGWVQLLLPKEVVEQPRAV